MVLNTTYKHIKSRIPNNWKYPVWYLFKAPQRAISKQSLINDLKGILIYLTRNINPLQSKNLAPISICTGLYNRSDMYLQHFMNSINQCEHKDLIELSVFDCNSTDVNNLKERIQEKWGGALVYRKQDIRFSRSYSFNNAVKQASNNLLFICDADMSLPPNIVSLCNQLAGNKKVWYPIYLFLYPQKYAQVLGKIGEWELYGSKGMLAVTKTDWEQIGGLDESYTVWGEEDTNLWERFHKAGFIVIRNKQPLFLHHWHNSFNPKYSHMNE